MNRLCKFNFKKNKLIVLFFIFTIFIFMFIFLLYNNKKIEVAHIEYINEKLPKSFDNFSICQISDLHNTEFGKNQKDLIEKINNLKPDIIVITGDLIDSSKYNIEIAEYLIKGIKDIAPIYYIPGNHEARINNYDEIKKLLLDNDVYVLDNSYRTIKNNNEYITIIGVIDPSFYSNDILNIMENIIDTTIDDLEYNDSFKLLLSHRPELFEIYVKKNIDLVLTGHAHGGQVRIPLIGGLIAPNQGLFPKYDSGMFTKNNTTMYVSRGLGNSIIPLRINNNPELVNITLKYK